MTALRHLFQSLPFISGLVWACCLLAGEGPSPWKIDPKAALAPGKSGEWDDFAIASPSILKLPDKQIMLFQGTAFNGNEPRNAFGIAESTDGKSWTKHSQNPLLQPQVTSSEVYSAASFARWHGAYVGVCEVFNSPFVTDASSGKRGDGYASLRLVRSDDGLIWETDASAVLPVNRLFFLPLRVSIYGDGDALHLWWLDVQEGGGVLAHVLSRDGKSWSKPNTQPTKDIDSRPVCCARVYPSGDFYILTYVVSENFDRVHRVVTKISNNARSWVAKGPPEFLLPHHDDYHEAPFMVFESDGARLFYGETQRDNRIELRSAYCRKENYAGQ